MKTGRLTENADNSGSGTLNNYHIKTLMLWVCELKTRSWWTDSFSFTTICADLLRLLSQWLNQGYCPHYFIAGCNLLDHYDRTNQILAAEQLSGIDQREVIEWFIGDYLQKCCQRCPLNILQLFDDVGTCEQLQTAVSALVDYRLRTVLYDSWLAFISAMVDMSTSLSYTTNTPRGSLSVRSYFCGSKN